MKSVCFIALLAASVYMPFSASAEVIINEIAWMGTDEGGANCEWIELRNTGSDTVDLTGWTLTIENTNAAPRVLLLSERGANSAGEIDRYAGIAGNGYYILARSSTNSGVACDDDFLGINADWFNSFGNGISNTRASLTLMGPNGEKDVVSASADWTDEGGLGGKNTAPKQTAQRSGTSWITAVPTARNHNHSAPIEELPEEEVEEGAPVVTVGGSAPLLPLSHPVPTLRLDAGPSRVVLAGADTRFEAVVYDSVGVRRRGADIVWTFGDAGQEKGEKVLYAYRKPGTYTAVVRAKDDGASVATLITVSVVEPGLLIESVDEEGVTLRNSSDTLADLSGWGIGFGKRTAKLPDDTVVASHSSAFFPYAALRIASSSNQKATLHFPNGKLAHAYMQPGEGVKKLYEIQAQAPEKPLAITPRAHAQEAVSAPAAEASLPVAGALYGEEPTVILKKKEGLFSGVGSLVATAFSSVAGIFSR